MPLRTMIASIFLTMGIMPIDRLAADAVDRLAPDRLEATHQAVLRLRSERRELPRVGPLYDFRANLHVHSALSHDSRGTVDEIVRAAKAVGTQVILFTEHPANHYDFYRDGHRGLQDGVLLIPGAEMKGLLVFPRQSVQNLDSALVQDFAHLVQRGGGLTFLSHLEERMDWELDGLTGNEIYNTHADFKDETRLLAQLRNPLSLLDIVERVRQYPQETYSALQDCPAGYLRRWDQLCEQAPHTGIAANDAHQNTGLTVRLAEGGKARVEDALGEKLLELDLAALARWLPAHTAVREADSVLLQLRLDPYEFSLRHVGTHLLMPELTEAGVWQALEAGRAFVAFDWLADSAGFDVAVMREEKRFEMGSRVPFGGNLKLIGQAPLPGHWKLICNGQLANESAGSMLEAEIHTPGRYRVEVWLDVAGEEKVWILTNPFYVAAE